MSRDPQFNLRIKPSLKDWVIKKAKEDDRSINGFINRLIREAKEHEENETREAA